MTTATVIEVPIVAGVGGLSATVQRALTAVEDGGGEVVSVSHAAHDIDHRGAARVWSVLITYRPASAPGVSGP